MFVPAIEGDNERNSCDGKRNGEASGRCRGNRNLVANFAASQQRVGLKFLTYLLDGVHVSTFCRQTILTVLASLIRATIDCVGDKENRTSLELLPEGGVRGYNSLRRFPHEPKARASRDEEW